MKFKTTQKAIKNNYSNIICVPYCGLQSLLNYKNPIAYTTRVEGWGADIYEVNNNTVIVTGYAPFGKIKPAYETRKKYETAAEKILYDYSINFEDRTKQLNNLLNDFINEVINND